MLFPIVRGNQRTESVSNLSPLHLCCSFSGKAISKVSLKPARFKSYFHVEKKRNAILFVAKSANDVTTKFCLGRDVALSAIVSFAPTVFPQLFSLRKT